MDSEGAEYPLGGTENAGRDYLHPRAGHRKEASWVQSFAHVSKALMSGFWVIWWLMFAALDQWFQIVPHPPPTGRLFWWVMHL